LCVEARNNGQDMIPVHLFPTRLNQENFQLLSDQYDDKKLIDFWSQLKKGYTYFEKNKKIPRVIVHPDGAYQFFEEKI
jgi:murein L,D-transpeptidase YafK